MKNYLADTFKNVFIYFNISYNGPFRIQICLNK